MQKDRYFYQDEHRLTDYFTQLLSQVLQYMWTSLLTQMGCYCCPMSYFTDSWLCWGNHQAEGQGSRDALVETLITAAGFYKVLVTIVAEMKIPGNTIILVRNKIAQSELHLKLRRNLRLVLLSYKLLQKEH